MRNAPKVRHNDPTIDHAAAGKAARREAKKRDKASETRARRIIRWLNNRAESSLLPATHPILAMIPSQPEARVEVLVCGQWIEARM